MKKILIILLAIAFNVFAQGEGDRIVNPFWKLSGGALSPTVSTWTLTLPATTFSPSIVTPLIIGGTTTTSTLTYKTTTANGVAGARHIFVVGNNGATEAMTILNSGFVGVGIAAPTSPLHVVGDVKIVEVGIGNLVALSGDDIEINLDAAKGARIVLDKGAANREAHIEYLTNGVNKWYIGTSDSDIAGDGSEYYVGQTLGGTSPSIWLEINGNIGLGTITPYAQYSQVGALPIWYATDSDVNLQRTSLAFATDTAAIKIDASATQPIITFENTLGNGFTLATKLNGGGTFTGALNVSDTLRTGNYTTYSYIIPGGALVQSSSSSIKSNIKPLTTDLGQFKNVSPREYTFKEQNFYKIFDENSVEDSVDFKLNDSTIIKVSNKVVKDEARYKFITDNLKEAQDKAKVKYVGFLADEFNPKILSKESKEINTNELLATMWLKIQELEKRIEVLEKK